jgi:hypothetical protein
MQTLGLSDSTTRSESRLKSLFWPSIQSGADVDYLAVQGFWVCTIIGGVTLVMQVVAGNPISGVIIFILFHFGGIGVREHNPFAAGIMLAYYTVDFLASVVMVFANTPAIGIIKIIIMALLLSNLRATWIAAGWKPDSEEAALPARMADTFADKFSDQWPAFIWPKVKVLYYIFSFLCLVLIVSGLIIVYIQGSHIRTHG